MEKDINNYSDVKVLHAWINCPSTLQSHHCYHGEKVVAFIKEGAMIARVGLCSRQVNFNIPVKYLSKWV